MPRSFSVSTFLSFVSFSELFGFWLIFNTTLFSGCNFSRDYLVQSYMVSRSCCNASTPSSVCISFKMLRSSAYKNNSDDLDFSTSELIKITTRIGPSTDPCGTPEIASKVVDFFPFIVTYCLLFDKKSFIP